ncbi:YitT family protein [Arthrobacter sp. TMS1-12-1]
MDTTATRAPTRAPDTADAIVRHSVAEDILGMVTGTFTVSLGLFLLTTSGAVTGGTAGLALLLSYAGGLSFGVLFFAVNVPFFALAVWKKGWDFTLRTIVAVALVAGLSALHPLALGGLTPHPLYAALGGNLLAGVGLLILFRHRASLGGFNILALILQERLGWRAGYVQMALDTTVILAAFTVVEPPSVLLSAVGAVVLNLVVALNHRPGRYLGA